MMFRLRTPQGSILFTLAPGSSYKLVPASLSDSETLRDLMPTVRVSDLSVSVASGRYWLKGLYGSGYSWILEELSPQEEEEARARETKKPEEAEPETRPPGLARGRWLMHNHTLINLDHADKIAFTGSGDNWSVIIRIPSKEVVVIADLPSAEAAQATIEAIASHLGALVLV